MTELQQFSWHDPYQGRHIQASLYHIYQPERERLSLSAFLGTEDIGVHIVQISRVIGTYTLE